MSATYDFLKECGVFFVLTTDEQQPMGRPFGAIMEYKNSLFFSTATMKEVYKQLKTNPKVQIVAIKAGTRDWIRVNGVAVECNELDLKQQMLDRCPALKNRFPSADCQYYALFEITQKQALLNTDGQFQTID